MTILVLCREHELRREARGYVRAFQKRNVRLVYVDNSFPPNGSVRLLLNNCPEKPFLILHPETDFLLWGLPEVAIPSACFQIDTCAYTDRRIRWSMLFDYALLFVPGFEERFRKAGHPRPRMLPHAVEVEAFQEVSAARVCEVGWVGRIDGPLYASRRRILCNLADQFRMNEWQRAYSYEEMADVFKKSQVVVNVSRDDYPAGANLRVFEAMAAGALLLTRVPTDLSALGFREREHFVGYSHEDQVADLVRYYLDHGSDRRRIAEAARELVLREHTYDQRADELLNLLREDGGRLWAPARKWSGEEVRFVYLDYFAAHQRMDRAWKVWRQLARRSPGRALLGLRLMAGAATRDWRTKIPGCAS